MSGVFLFVLRCENMFSDFLHRGNIGICDCICIRLYSGRKITCLPWASHVTNFIKHIFNWFIAVFLEIMQIDRWKDCSLHSIHIADFFREVFCRVQNGRSVSGHAARSVIFRQPLKPNSTRKRGGTLCGKLNEKVQRLIFGGSLVPLSIKLMLPVTQFALLFHFHEGLGVFGSRSTAFAFELPRLSREIKHRQTAGCCGREAGKCNQVALQTLPVNVSSVAELAPVVGDFRGEDEEQYGPAAEYCDGRNDQCWPFEKNLIQPVFFLVIFHNPSFAGEAPETQ